MPVDMKKYPKNWPEIRTQILLRAGGNTEDPRINARCEWCGVRNYTVGYRVNGQFVAVEQHDSHGLAWLSVQALNRLQVMDGLRGPKYISVVLTIAHVIDDNPQNCDHDNLAALCQSCHNKHDAPMRGKRRTK